MLKYFLLYFSLFFLNITLFAQSYDAPDTLIQARGLMQQNHLKEANVLLIEYLNLHPDDVYAWWMHAQVNYALNKTSIALKSFKKAIHLDPDLHELSIDYCRFLQNTGKLAEAEKLIDSLLLTDSLQIELLYLKAKNNYWKGDMNKALFILQKLLLSYPADENAIKLLHEINFASAANFSFSGSWQADNQPYSIKTARVEGGIRKSSLLAPHLSLQFDQPGSENTYFEHYSAMASNVIRWNKIRLETTPWIGIYHFRNKKKSGSKIIYGLSADRNLFKQFNFSASFGRSVYMDNLSTLDTLTMRYYLHSSIQRYRPGHLWFSIGYQGDFFEDQNKVQAYYAWALWPLIQSSRWKIRAGYGANYSHSEAGRFVSVLPVSELLKDTAANAYPAGYYYPYFTPVRQQIHSLLLNITYIPDEKWQFRLKVNAGLFALSKYPSLQFTSYQDATWLLQTNWQTNRFSTYDIRMNISYKINEALQMHAWYRYELNHYYTGNRAGIQLKYRLIK